MIHQGVFLCPIFPDDILQTHSCISMSKENDTKKKKGLIEDIIQTCKNNDIPTTGELFFSLAFRTIGELKGIAGELNIKVN